MAIYDTQNGSALSEVEGLTIKKEGHSMEESALLEIMALKKMSAAGLRKKYEEVFDGKKAISSSKVYLWKQIAYRIQEMKNGGLSEESRAKIEELVKEYDPINNKALRPDKPMVDQQTPAKDKRLPIPGTVIIKEYKSMSYQVKVLEKGFEYNGKIYKSLSAIAKEITGAHWNGYLFFGL